MKPTLLAMVLAVPSVAVGLDRDNLRPSITVVHRTDGQPGYECRVFFRDARTKSLAAAASCYLKKNERRIVQVWIGPEHRAEVTVWVESSNVARFDSSERKAGRIVRRETGTAPVTVGTPVIP